MRVMFTPLRLASPRRLAAGALCIALLGLGLALDLANRGLAWQAFYQITGEEDPLAQLRGLMDWAGNLTRAPLELAPYTPIAHTDIHPFGINTFLEQEVLLERREQQVRMIADAGFTWIRQQFVWEDIEIDGPGDFTDRRNDPVRSAWDKYDHIVALAEQYDLDILARLDNPPQWAQTVAGNFAPPADFADFARFAATVAERYRGRIRYYQIWNEPNIYPEWGEQAVDPEAYTRLLCLAYEALRAVDPEIVVVAASLSPTVALTGRDLNDFIFMQRMYDAGAAECFDVAAVQGYGFFSGPTDQRLRPFELNFARHLYTRDIMVRNGDASTPIWITEAAWNPVDAPEVPPDVSGRANFGVATPEQAAAYMPQAYQRAQQEWPWVGTVFYWFFKRADYSEQNQSWFYFRMVDPDFTARPIYTTMQAYLQAHTPALYRGVHQAEHYAIAHDAEPVRIADPAAQLGGAETTAGVSFVAVGTQVRARWRSGDAAGHALRAAVDDAPVQDYHCAAAASYCESTLAHSLTPREWRITLASETPFLLDAITVRDDAARQLYPLLAGGGAVALFACIVLAQAVHTRRRNERP
jgi:hypothetical protein